MKKYLYIVLALFVSSCEGFLDSRPTSNVISELAITNLQEAKYAINGVYDCMQSSGLYGAAMFYIGDVKGDDMQTYSASSRTSYYCYLFDHKAYAVNASGIWANSYANIRYCYNVMAAFENGMVKDGSEAERAAVIGHAKALIALSYFDLTKLWGYPYAKDGGASLSVPFVDHVLSVDEHPDRITVKESFEFCVKMLNEAIPVLPKEKDAGRMNYYAAKALLSRVYLYMNDFAKAFSTADELLTEIESSGIYSLYPHDTYNDCFGVNAKLGSEALLEVVNSSSDNESWNCLAYLIHPFGYRENILTKDFEDLLLENRDDCRFGMMQYVEERDGRPFLTKYKGPEPNKPSRDNNYTIIRLSEVYLIAAEAATHLSGAQRSKGLEYLNAIVKRGNPRNSVSDAEYDLDRVLTERRLELVGEGHRYFDLLRNGKKIIRKGGYHLATAQEEIDWNFEKCVLPIPAAQFDFNPQMEQNPGYTKE